MADSSDVEQALADTVASLLYPGGNATAGSACGVDARVYRGWPTAKRLDADLSQGIAQVNVYEWPGVWRLSPLYQHRTRNIRPPPPTLTAAAEGNTVTLSGVPAANQLVGIAVGQIAYSYAVLANDTLDSIGAALAAMIQGSAVTDDTGAPLLNDDGTPVLTGLPVVLIANDGLTDDIGVTLTDDAGDPLLTDQAEAAAAAAASVTLTLGTTLPLRARVVGIGQVITEQRRQTAGFQIGIWAPTPAARDALARTIDAGLASIAFLPLPDQSARMLGHGNHSNDVTQKEGLWVRTLIVTVEYATTTTAPAPEVLWPQLVLNATATVTV